MDLINNCSEGADRSILARGHHTSDSYLKRQGVPYYKKIYYSSTCFKNYRRNTNRLHYTLSAGPPGTTALSSRQVFCTRAYLKTLVQIRFQQHNSAEVRRLCRCNQMQMLIHINWTIKYINLTQPSDASSHFPIFPKSLYKFSQLTICKLLGKTFFVISFLDFGVFFPPSLF